jgi:hypothetical protein
VNGSFAPQAVVLTPLDRRTFPRQEPDLSANGSAERSGRVHRGLFLETAIADAYALQAFEQEFDAVPLES